MMNPKIKSFFLSLFLLTFSLAPSLLFSEECREINNCFTMGPILTPSAHNTPLGEHVFQFYTSGEEELGGFDDNRQLFDKMNHDLVKFKRSLIFSWGLANWLDLSFTLNDQTNYQKDQSSTHFGDTQVGLGFQLLKEKKAFPAVRFTITKNLPTGNYEKLTPGRERVETSGSGSLDTSFALTVGKKFEWITSHPLNLSASFKYTIPTRVHADGSNAYIQGDFLKSDYCKVRPGRGMKANAAVELSLRQNLFLACDLVYKYQYQSETLTGGSNSLRTLPSSDSLICASAVKYAISENLGFRLGGWYTITGRNTPRSVGGLFSATFSW